MPRLTERVVNRARPRKTKYEISCSVLTGFILRVLPSGKKVYYVRYRDACGKDLRVRLGPTSELTYAEALTLATGKLSGIEATPAARHSNPVTESAAPLLAEFAERFQREHTRIHLKPQLPTQATPG